MEDLDVNSDVKREARTHIHKPEDEIKGHITFTDVGPHSVHLEWVALCVNKNANVKFQIKWKKDETEFSKTTNANYFDIKQLSPGTSYNITVVAIEGKMKTSFSASVCTAIPTPENFEYVAVEPTTVRLSWTSPKNIDPSLYKLKITMYENEEEIESVTIKSNTIDFVMPDLSPATEYKATLNTILSNGKQSDPADLIIHTMPLPPQELRIKIGATSVSLKWTDPITDDMIKHRFRVVCSDGANSIESFTNEEEENVFSLKPGMEYTFSVYTLVNLNSKDLESLPVKITQRTNINMESVLMEMGLHHHLVNKLTLKSVLELRKPDEQQTAHSITALPWLFLRKLMMVNSSARSIKCASKSNSKTCDQKSINLTEEHNGFYRDQEGMNPLDLITALFHCADPFLRQEMALKMSMCQFSVPLLLPNCDTQECTLMLWALRDITKTFRSHSLKEESLEENSIVLTDLPLISFVRLGKSSLSKTEYLNHLLRNKEQHHDTFVHRKLINGNIHRRISNGFVEMSWYIPGQTKSDIFEEPVAVANLRGDISDFELQFAFLSQTSSAVFAFCDDFDSNQTFLESLQLSTKLFLVCDQNVSTSVDNLKQTLGQMNDKKYSVILKGNLNEAEFAEKLQEAVVDVLKDRKLMRESIEKMPKIALELGIRVDENDEICQNAKKIADRIAKEIENIPEYKTRELPLQAKLWKKLSKLEKEICRLKKAKKQNIEHYKSALKGQIQDLRKEQGSYGMREAMSLFISGLSCSLNMQLYFLKWMKINLDSLTRKHLSSLEEKYRKACTNPTEDKEHHRNLEKLIANSSLGVQHFMRELGQLYESAQLQENCEYRQLMKLPEICAQLMLNGFPLELIDGDASNIPLRWIKDVLTALNKLTNPHNKIRVVTVLGVQSTGKSTLLNTMFGVQFAVSSGRCTRGAFMLLIDVSKEFKEELRCDYLLIIDTEGLKSLELTKLAESYEHDNELATLVVGLSDLTIVNIAMENATEMKDTLQIVVHAFLRMKEVGKRPSCHFVHQNTADVAAREKILREKKIFLEQLDAMTKVAGKMEKRGHNRKFTDILEYSIDGNNWYIPGLWLGTPPMAPVSTGYSEKVNNLKNGILNVFKATKVPVQNFLEFEEWIQSLWKAVQFENFIFGFRNSLVADAYSKLCTEFNTWEWEFRKHMIDWCTKSETKITNMDALHIDGALVDLKHEAADELDKQAKNIFGKIEHYFESEDEHVQLVENHKEDFLNSARGLRMETCVNLQNKLENAVVMQRGIKKVELIKQKQRDTMREKALHLISVCQNKVNKLSESELDDEFEKMWAEIVEQCSFTALQRQNVAKETFRLLYSNLEIKGGAVQEILSNITSLDQCGRQPFLAKVETENVFKKIRHSFLPEQRSTRNVFLQLACEEIINDCEIVIGIKTRPQSDYNIADIQDLLLLIEKKLEKHTDIQISPENEASLKIHICGNAARAFQKMHDEFLQSTDPLKSLERFKVQWLSDFKDLYYQRDQCQNKAETCAMKCFAPAVMDYIQKQLGPEIVQEMLTSKRAVDFSTRTFFQYSLLNQLLKGQDFKKILNYVENYEKFVNEWISEKITEHFSKEGVLRKLEMKHLNKIIQKLKKANEKVQSRADCLSKDASMATDICSFVTKIFTYLDKELVIPTDTLNATLTLNNCNPVEFADCLTSSINKMYQSLADQLLRENDVKAKLTRCNISQEVLFNRVFGCGKKCPFCSAPCEAGGKKHTEHFASVHRPQGIGNYRWIQSDKLIPDICSSLVASEMTFRCKDTGYQWHPYKQYREIYPDWRIQPDISIEATDFWKYIFAKYNTTFAQRYNSKPAEIPSDWYNISVHQANKCLEDTFLLRSHPPKNAEICLV